MNYSPRNLILSSILSILTLGTILILGPLLYILFGSDIIGSYILFTIFIILSVITIRDQSVQNYFLSLYLRIIYWIQVSLLLYNYQENYLQTLYKLYVHPNSTVPLLLCANIRDGDLTDYVTAIVITKYSYGCIRIRLDTLISSSDPVSICWNDSEDINSDVVCSVCQDNSMSIELSMDGVGFGESKLSSFYCESCFDSLVDKLKQELDSDEVIKRVI